jgi:hypothetical protein
MQAGAATAEADSGEPLYGWMRGRCCDADIGGSLIKLVYFSSDRSTPNGGRLHFKKWETKHYRDCINYIKRKRCVYGRRVDAR